jgi:hypothetical protein
MRAKRFLTLVFVGCSAASGAAAQGTREFSNPGPTMVYPIRPRVEPARPTATPNTSGVEPVVPRLRRVQPIRPSSR